MPASLWAKSTMTSRVAETEQVESAGRAIGRRSEVDEAVTRPASIDAPRPRAAAAAARTLATLWRARPPIVIGMVRTSAIRSRRGPGALDEPAALDEVGEPAGRLVAADDRGQRARFGDAEVRDGSADPAADRGDERIVAIEHDPTVRLRHPADRRLDLGELRQRVDALEVEVVRRDVGEDADLVRLVAHAAQDESAPGRLEDRDVEVRAAEDRCAPPGPVQSPGFDHPLVDEDTVRGRRPDVSAGGDEDVGDQPGHRRLAVRAGDRHRRDASVRVADPRRRGDAGRGDALRPARDVPFLGTRQLRRARWRDVPFGERQCGLGEGPGTLLADPRERHDPVPGVGRSMDGQTTSALAVVGTQAADPGDDRLDARPASRATGPRRRDGRAGGGPDRAGRTRSDAGRRRPRV